MAGVLDTRRVLRQLQVASLGQRSNIEVDGTLVSNSKRRKRSGD